MVKEGLMGFAANDLAGSESAVHDNDAKIDDYNARLAQIDGQLQQIETRALALQRQIMTDATARRNEIEQIRKSVELDRFQIVRDGSVRSQYSGRVAEVMAAVGQVVPAGGKLLTLEADGSSQADDGLVSISYYPVKDSGHSRHGGAGTLWRHRGDGNVGLARARHA
jgi:biotin carboxyl carrier protein